MLLIVVHSACSFAILCSRWSCPKSPSILSPSPHGHCPHGVSAELLLKLTCWIPCLHLFPFKFSLQSNLCKTWVIYDSSFSTFDGSPLTPKSSNFVSVVGQCVPLQNHLLLFPSGPPTPQSGSEPTWLVKTWPERGAISTRAILLTALL